MPSAATRTTGPSPSGHDAIKRGARTGELDSSTTALRYSARDVLVLKSRMVVIHKEMVVGLVENSVARTHDDAFEHEHFVCTTVCFTQDET